MSEFIFNRNNPRVVRSRMRMRIKMSIVRVMYMSGVVGCLFAAVLVVFGFDYGWFLASASTLPIMFYMWYSADVKNIPIQTGGKTMEELMSAELLSIVKTTSITTTDIIQACMKIDGYLFFARRFNITQEMLEKTSDVNPEAWWSLAQQLWHDIPDEDGIDASYIVVALVLSSSSKQIILSSASTNEKDIVQGLAWLAYWKQMFRTVHSRKATGGIARDWATGYTPMLNRFAYNISKDIQYGGSYHRDVFGHRSIVVQMHSIFTQSGRNNIMLVGAQGVGKTTCVEAFADTLLFETPGNSPLRFNQLYRVDTAAMLTQMNSQNSLENAVVSMAVEAKKAKNIVLYFPDVANLFGIEGGIDISNAMLPVVQKRHIQDYIFCH
jgi:ATP-dependent Clp protease ATP-binding subunit ClpC